MTPLLSAINLINSLYYSSKECDLKANLILYSMMPSSQRKDPMHGFGWWLVGLERASRSRVMPAVGLQLL